MNNPNRKGGATMIYEDENRDLIDGVGFARPGSALRAASKKKRLSAAAPRMASAILSLIHRGFCPSCGCNLWNTKGCPVCPLMRELHDSLVDAGILSPATFPEYDEPSETNIENMKGVSKKGG